MISAAIASELINVRGKPNIHLHSNTGKLVFQSWGGTSDKTQIIDVDKIVSTMNMQACQRCILQFPEEQTPHSGYPFSLHDVQTLPWDYSVCNGMMTLYARGCSGYGVDQWLGAAKN